MWFELYDLGGVSLLGVKSALAQSRTKEGLIDACVHLANINRHDRDRQRIVCDKSVNGSRVCSMYKAISST